MTSIDVAIPPGAALGWAPIFDLAQVAAKLFDGEIVHYPDVYPGKLQKLWGLRPRARGTRDRGLMALLYGPADISKLRESLSFRQDYRFVIAWIIDSFWEDRNVRKMDFGGVDLLCIIRRDEEDYYRRLVGNRVLSLNWGSNVLERGSAQAERPIDLQRLGRQPTEWNDDERSAQVARELGLVFAGRPPEPRDPAANMKEIARAFGSAKYLVAHSNLTSIEPNTHKVKEYITARWTDALASGCSIAGVQPRNDSSYRDLFWPGATLDFDRVDLRHNMAAVAEAVSAWTPEQARNNYRMSLQRLDWRHSLKKIADRMQLSFPALDAELAEIRRKAVS
ncbi:hypothetical protein PAF17_04655 [Paracoccus sp. Z330]|uniref:Glycosyltransferase family 1 protein n=1 Tax=Paracoccus onchidii TaxID=3017813 RepID=A0ABT4ZC07_9RHOB|nr:hypothetical protein [Paracoccus onchidii]MDB6176795.1 hypothetical protein [Paracoccus onchidii]